MIRHQGVTEALMPRSFSPKKAAPVEPTFFESKACRSKPSLARTTSSGRPRSAPFARRGYRSKTRHLQRPASEATRQGFVPHFSVIGTATVKKNPFRNAKSGLRAER